MDNNIHPGKDGFSIDDVKQLIRAHPTRQGIISPSDIYVEEQTTFLNRTIAQPIVSKEIADYIAGGQMIRISKKNGKLRAITMSDLGKKIVLIESNRQNKAEIKEEFKDFQTAVGCKNGPDKLVVAARLGMEKHPENDVMVTDCAKAFLNTNRDVSLEKVNEKFPNMMNMLVPLLGSEANFFYTGPEEGTQIIKVANGITAGDNTSPMLFALVKGGHTRDQVIIDYADDQYAGAPTQQMVLMTKFNNKEGPKYGLYPETSKSDCLIGERESLEEAQRCKQQCVEECRVIPDQVKLSPMNDKSPEAAGKYGVTVIGISIGIKEYISKFLLDKIEEAERQFKKMAEVCDAHVKCYILSKCMKFKINHILTQIPPSYLEEVVERFSKAQRECLCEILRAPLISEDAWRVVRINNGGVLQFIEDMPQPAFVASMIAGLQYAAEKVVGVNDMITEALF
jgi:hypothetical protein